MGVRVRNGGCWVKEIEEMEDREENFQLWKSSMLLSRRDVRRVRLRKSQTHSPALASAGAGAGAAMIPNVIRQQEL
jgi:hypothetical protein